MMMMTKKWYVFLFVPFLTLAAYPQENDFGIWYGVSAQKKITSNFDVEFSTSIRTFDTASKIEETFLEGGVAYNLNKYLETSVSYRISKSIEKNNSYYFRHKYFINLKGTVPVRNFDFSCRLKFQTGIKTYIEDSEDEHPGYTGRIKLKALYKTQSFPINPYLYYESFSPLFSDKSRIVEKNRYAAGIVYKIAKKHSVEIEYIFQRDYLPQISDINIMSLNYVIKF
jgi:hypothetical protein